MQEKVHTESIPTKFTGYRLLQLIVLFIKFILVDYFHAF